MYFMHPTAPIILETDASDFGIGGYLYQLVDNVARPVSKEKMRWSVPQKEKKCMQYIMHL